ncbi:putative aspartic-type endopeptidase CTSD [Grifola frondosa]|uniref:Putative aspartic-type endopeptidase CTSD n=1 Tax=Grifola frondosa TaxID=5627 RepID=A0A1C7LWD2_GRIFR|nr:putative aspartic-type endopeptidase CTSD [Grifola frondosa]
MRSLLPVFSLFLLDVLNVNALKLPFHVRQRSARLNARATSIPISNTRNSEYISNITLGGREIPVLLDTGSSDLWVTGTVPQTKDLGISASLSYAVGNAAGNINSATLEFDGYTVQDQAYLLVANASGFSINITAQGFEGLIGLGPNTGSVIRDKVNNDSGDSVLDRIFSQNTTSANYLTVLLNREGDPTSPATGQLTISEPVSGYENITSMPKLTVEKVHKLTDADQHWQVLTDTNGVIGPDGQPIEVDSIVPSAPNGQLVVVFDSGFTLPQVPRAMSDAIYGRVQGAEYNEASEVWTIPCDQLLNISFKFGGVDYPIHPLDVSSSDFNMVDSSGNPTCVGTFQPITSAFSLLGEYDIILGMAFMRNVYSLFDYGDFIDNSALDRNDPFVQLLSITDVAQSHSDFVKARLNGVDTTSDTSQDLLPTDQMQHSPISAAEKKKKYEEMILSRWPAIFVGCLIFVLLVIGLIIWRCCVARRRRRAKQAAGHLPTNNTPKTYEQIQESTSQVDLKLMESGKEYEYRSSYASNMHRGRTARVDPTVLLNLLSCQNGPHTQYYSHQVKLA